MTAMHEFVVPKSMPKTFAIKFKCSEGDFLLKADY